MSQTVNPALTAGLEMLALGVPVHLYLPDRADPVEVIPDDAGRLHRLLAGHPEIAVATPLSGRPEPKVLTGAAVPRVYSLAARVGGVLALPESERPAEKVLAALQGLGYPIKRRGRTWRSRCPYHGGQSENSLSVTEFKDGGAWVYCFAGCRAGDVIDVLGLGWRDLFPPELSEPDGGPDSGAGLPEIIVSGRPLRHVSADALKALVMANEPPAIFVRGDRLVRVQGGDAQEPARIVTLGEHHLRGHLTRCGDFIRIDKTGEVNQGSPPRDLVFDLLTLDAWPFPRLQGVIQSPVLRPDGTILDQPGYDPATGLYYAPPAGFRLPQVSLRPTDAEVADALGLLGDAFADFPYENDASRANALALLLTPVVRPVIAGQVPLALLDAPTPGTGKGLHAEIVSVIATGGTAAVTSAPKAEEEFRKRITSTLLRGQPVVLLDNLEGPLASASLAAALTAPVWQDRQLGENRLVTVPSRVTWMATGNNLRLGGDLPRRAYWIRLDARVAQPWRRSRFRHLNLGAYVQAHRPELLAALFTLVCAWQADGRPAESVPRLGSFEEWAAVVGGILGVVGIDGFLTNLDALYERADVETPAWTAFLEAWRNQFGENPVTAAEVISATDQHRALANALPAEVVDARPERRSRALGTALGQREGRRFGEDELQVLRAGTEHRALTWQVVSQVSLTHRIVNCS